uniref:protein LIAT1 n=1 Tax=Scatophagus argus TaxID=75038 RepID=UPI001ED81829|nr:protein LIAT1 [Scatophagus argus]XP_046267324.1 protein LIAT1 [Scatophagus argus]XP_046267325.1 protein LIAT1 [Scatophagus argus]
MPEDRNCKLLHSSRSSDKKTKKKRKKATASATPPENTDKPQVVSLPPETLPRPPQLPKLRGTSKKDVERLSGCGRRSKKDNPKDSSSLLIATNKNTAHGAPVQGYVDELSAQARESLRWQGELEDPQAEEKRLELYRANRRQRYISHKEALLKEAQYALKQTFLKESKEIKALTGCDQQEQRLN